MAGGIARELSGVLSEVVETKQSSQRSAGYGGRMHEVLTMVSRMVKSTR